MRSSSIKTTLVVLTVTVTLAAAAPRAEAAPSRGTARTYASATDRFQRAVNQLLNRVFGISSSALPTDPIPMKFSETETETTTTTRTTPKSQR